MRNPKYFRGFSGWWNIRTARLDPLWLKPEFLRSESSLFMEGTELGGLRILFDLYALRCIAWVSSMITGTASRIYEVPALSSLCQPNPAEGWKGPNHSKGFKFSRANTILRGLESRRDESSHSWNMRACSCDFVCLCVFFKRHSPHIESSIKCTCTPFYSSRHLVPLRRVNSEIMVCDKCTLHVGFFVTNKARWGNHCIWWILSHLHNPCQKLRHPAVGKGLP